MVRKNRLLIPTPPALSSIACQTELAALLADPTRNIVRDLYVGRTQQPDLSYKDTVRDDLRELYDFKCAYCERITHAPHVEHYRPKKTRLRGRMFKGYYWLAYEWSNLLPSCGHCNAPGKKDTKFPINTLMNFSYPRFPATANPDFSQFHCTSIYNRAEDPMLLHPEYCFPRHHFRAAPNGALLALTDKAQVTIDTVDLNDPDLKGGRRKIYEDHFRGFSLALSMRYTGLHPITVPQFEQMIKNQVKILVDESNNQRLDFSFYRKELVRWIDRFFIDPFHIYYQPALRRAIVNALRTI